MSRQPQLALILFFATLALIAAASAPARAECLGTRVYIALGVTRSDVSWRTGKDQECEGLLEANRWSSGVVALDKFTIEQRAAHGIAGIYSNFRFAYKPNLGFVGKDHFVGLVTYKRDRSNIRPVDSEARINVDVEIVDTPVNHHR